jgi:putative ABC transport system ATP-binding protein
VDIRVESVSKTYRLGDGEVRAVRDVSLDLPAGEFLSLSGPSGAGKSTLLGLIGGLERPDEGHVWAGESDLAALGSEDLAMYRRHSVGFVFQAFRLLPALTAFENVMMPLVPLPAPEGEKRDKVMAALERANIAHRADHLPGELSGGEQQRVAIARAIVNEPDLVLADEPTGELDRDNGRRIMELLRDLNSDGTTTVLLASHDPEVVEAARRIVKLVDGHIQPDDTKDG